ncbi:MAG: LuxR family transcriptional regulator, partial [Anaerolinea sp.]|nr:LuxR family transcriptional regulator [Anaerolinea sp.]
MSFSILTTKLFLPSSRPNLVSRPRLIDLLNQGSSVLRRLILVSAPAGFGKTTLVSEWIATCKEPVAWLSLDEGDNDQVRFLVYLINALQTIKPKIAKRLLDSMDPSQNLNESQLTNLLNEIAVIPESFILVLDDYHLIDSALIDQNLTFLIDHMPPNMRLVITTREDPSLPLARYRARGQLTEIRAADLRFTPQEAAIFLNKVMGLNLAEENITALENRTEGWIVGLQLAALSMQGRDDISSFVRAFTGSHRFVLDYLVEEVLKHQTGRIRDFLVETAFLESFCAPLCDEITEREGSQEILDYLDRNNLFLIPLDD